MVIQTEVTLQADHVLSACDGEKSRISEIVILGRTVGIICESVSVTDEFTESIDARLSVNVFLVYIFKCVITLCI